MKKELIVILLLFLVVFTSVSILSHSPQDPSINHQAFSSEHIHNLFGLVGAHLSGLLVGFFGVASLWLPLFIFLCAFWYLNQKKSGKQITMSITGGLMLLFSTAGLLSIIRKNIIVRGGEISSGGLTGSAISGFLLEYTNVAGSVIIILFFIFAGVVIATGISASTFVFTINRFVFLFLRFVGLKTVETHDLIIKVAGKIKKGDSFNVSAFSALKNLAKINLGRLANTRLDLNPEDISSDTRSSAMGFVSLESLAQKIKYSSLKTTNVQSTEIRNGEFRKTDSDQFLKQDSSIFDDNDARFNSVESNTSELPENSRNYPVTPSKSPEKESENFTLPPLSLLNEKQKSSDGPDIVTLRQKGEILENKLKDFGVKGEIVDILPGPVITTFEYRPAPGVKISKIVNLTDDLALALSALSIRIVAPIPGKDVVGIEIPNDKREIVLLRELLSSDEFAESSSRLTLALGKDIIGNPVSAAMDSMPHLLIAGATGTGKSVGLNSMIISLLYKATPKDVKFIMVDPKRIELSVYDGIPHLISPVVTDMKKATNALFWAVREMERRYELLAQSGVRNLLQYNTMVEQQLCNKSSAQFNGNSTQHPWNSTEEDILDTAAISDLPAKLPYIIVIVDEFADLMMVASRDVESALIRLAQMARAAGIHLLLATQRPSVDVLTGIIKANFPTRVSFQVSSRIDSRTILDTNGAERLLGNGDMLFLPPGTGRLQRIQGAYISEEEIARVTAFVKDQQQPDYVEDITEKMESEGESNDGEPYDEKYDEAVALVTRTRQASISSVQRHLRIGYNRAARIIETMEREGLVGPQDGSKPREVLVKSYDD